MSTNNQHSYQIGQSHGFANGYFPNGDSRPLRFGTITEMLGDHFRTDTHSPWFARIRWNDTGDTETVTLRAICA